MKLPKKGIGAEGGFARPHRHEGLATMKRLIGFLISCMILLAFPACSDSSLKTALIGTWEWTGDDCDVEGNCAKEIIADEQSWETFSRDGIYISKNTRNSYSLKGKTIYLASDKNSYDTSFAEILLIKNGMMLLNLNNRIRRYAKMAEK
jgi:hypothetical protein